MIPRDLPTASVMSRMSCPASNMFRMTRHFFGVSCQTQYILGTDEDKSREPEFVYSGLLILNVPYHSLPVTRKTHITCCSSGKLTVINFQTPNEWTWF